MIAQPKLRDVDAAPSSATQQRTAAEQVTEIAFIDHGEFSHLRLSAPTIERRLARLLAVDSTVAAVSADRTRSAHLLRLCATPLLTPEQERELFRLMNYCKYRANAARAKVGPRSGGRKLNDAQRFLELADGLRNHIVNANVRLVVSLVKKFADMQNDFDELFSEGVNSLMRAVDKFDFSRGFRFSTYATCAVRRELANYVNRAAKQRTRFSSGVGQLLQSSLEPELPQTLAPEVHSEHYHTLCKLLRKLDHRERRILQARYGFQSDIGKRTFQSLGDELGVCKERIRQLESRALRKLREMAEAWGFDPELA